MAERVSGWPDPALAIKVMAVVEGAEEWLIMTVINHACAGYLRELVFA